MKNKIKTALHRLGLCRLSHSIRNKHKLTVIMLHRILPEEELSIQGCDREWTLTTKEFDSLLSFLKKHYTIISEQDLINFKTNNIKLPKYPLILTFDDGWYDNYQYALPLLKKHNLPALIFIATNWINSSVGFWQEQIVSACQKQPTLFEEIKEILALQHLMNVAQLIKLLDRDDQEAHRQKVLSKIATALPVNRQMMSTQELKQLLDSNISLGGHGASHSKLDSLTPTQHNQELIDSYSMISELTDKSCLSMSFPHGRYNEQITQQAVDTGFSLLFSSNKGTSTFEQPIYNRIHVSFRNIMNHNKFDACKSSFFFFFQ